MHRLLLLVLTAALGCGPRRTPDPAGTTPPPPSAAGGPLAPVGNRPSGTAEGSNGGAAAGPTPELVSLSAPGVPAGADSVITAGGLSTNGQLVVFTSAAPEIAGSSTPVPAQVVVRDRAAGTTEVVTVTTSGGFSAGVASGAAVSADGRRVVFGSLAADLVPTPTGGVGAVFLRDRQAGVTTLLSRAFAGGVADGASADPAISADGSLVAFDSVADDLVASDRNRARDVFVVETATGLVSLVSVTTGGAQGSADSAYPALSPDGRFVAFASAAAELAPGLDRNGTFGDVYLRDRVLGTTTLVSGDVAGNTGDGPSGGPGMQAASLGGGRVAFTTRATTLLAGLPAGPSQVLVRDLGSGAFMLGSAGTGGAPGDADSLGCSLSADGRFVAFVSLATNLDAASLPGPGVYVRDLDTSRTARLDPSPAAGGPSPALGAPPVISPDGTIVAWTAQGGTAAPAGATAGVAQVFVAPNPLAP